jgi:hypothetical protein
MGNTLIVVLTCGHEKDYTGWSPMGLPAVGDEHSCWSACDKVPAWRGAGNPYVRHVKRVEIRSDMTGPLPPVRNADALSPKETERRWEAWWGSVGEQLASEVAEGLQDT